MIDQTTPPFATGDLAYARAAPGGYGSPGAIPADPAYGGSDKAYAVPSLGGEFQPGSGKAAPTGSPFSKGADPDGGAADIASAPRIGTPPAPVPPTIPPLAVEVAGTNLTFSGAADVAKTVTVSFEVNDDGVARNVVCPIPAGTSAGAAAAIVAARLNSAQYTTGSTTSNQVHVGAKTPNVLGADPVTCAIT